MNCLWDRPEGLSSRQILALLGDDDLACTTVLTVLSRLCDTSLVTRIQDGGRGLLFKATLTGNAHNATVLLGPRGKSADLTICSSHVDSGLSPNQLAELKDVLGK